MKEIKRQARRGRWYYDPGHGWRMDGTSVLIDFDRLAKTWYAMSGPKAHQPIDRYLDAAMAHVEEHVAEYVTAAEVEQHHADHRTLVEVARNVWAGPVQHDRACLVPA